MPRCRKRFDAIFDREKQPDQPRAVVQQEELGRVAEEARPVDQPVQVDQERQRAMIQEPIAIPPQPSSSSHEDPTQVNTTLRRGIIPEDEDDTRPVRPRLDMSALISELCERDMPEVDSGKLGENSSSVFDTHAGLKLDGARVKAGRETEVKSMLAIGVYEEVSEELASGKRIWNSSWLDTQKKVGLVGSKLFVNKSEVKWKRDDVFAAAPLHAATRSISSRAASRGHGRCLGLWNVSVAFFHAPIEEEVFVRPPKKHEERQDHLETAESHVRHTYYKFTLAKAGA